MFPLLSNTSHSLTVLSQEEDVRIEREGENARPLTGPS